MCAEDPFRDQPAGCAKYMVDLCASFRRQRRHVESAFAVANDHNLFAVEHIQRRDITFGGDPAFELFLIEKLRQILAIGVLSRREQKKIKMVLLNTLLVFITDEPALRVFFCFKNLVVESDVELVVSYR